MPADRRELTRAVLLVAVGGAALALRFVGLDWGLPWSLHPDEPLIFDIAERMSWANLNPDFFHYPSFFIYQVFLLSRVVFPLGGEYADLVYAARALSAAYGLITVWLVYLLGTRLADRRLGTIAAALTALMGSLTLHAHYAVTDTTATALVTAVLWLSVRAWQRRSLPGLVLATAVAGLAVSTKYNVAPICLVPWVGAMALATRRGMPYGKRIAATVALAGVAIGGYLVGTPYTVLDRQAFVRDLREEVVLQAEARAGEHSEPLLDPELSQRGLVGNVGALYDDMGPAAFGMAIGTLLVLIASMVRAARRRVAPAQSAASAGDAAAHPRDPGSDVAEGSTGSDPYASAFERMAADPIASLMVVVWLLGYFAMMASSAKYGGRYVVPMYPAMMLLAAVPVWGALVAEQGYGRLRAWSLAAVAFVVAAAPPTAEAINSTRLLAQRDTRLVARDWIVDNLPPGSRLAREFYAPRLYTSDGFRLLQLFSLTDWSFEAFCNDDVDYLLLSSINALRYREEPERFPDRLAWYDRLDEHTRLVHRVDGKGNLRRHHPTIEIRLLFCRADGRAPNE